MNNDIQERACWSLLAQKAEEKSELVRLELNQAGHRLNQLQASRQRLQNMYDGYSAESLQLGQAHLGMSQSLMVRQFMSQLQTLIKRVDVDMTHTLNLRDALLEKMAEFEKERIKMNTLAEKNKAELQAQARQRELNQMNEWAALQFNRNKAA